MRQCGSFVVCCGAVLFTKVTCFLDDGLVMWKPLPNSSLASWSCTAWRAPQNGHKAATVNQTALVARADSVEQLLVKDMAPTDLPILRAQVDTGHLPMALLGSVDHLSLFIYASTLCRTMGWTSSTTQKGCISQDAGR